MPEQRLKIVYSSSTRNERAALTLPYAAVYVVSTVACSFYGKDGRALCIRIDTGLLLSIPELPLPNVLSGNRQREIGLLRTMV